MKFVSRPAVMKNLQIIGAKDVNLETLIVAAAVLRSVSVSAFNLRKEDVVARVLGGYSEQAYALLRIVLGSLFFCHGGQKVFGWFGGIDGKGSAVPLESLFGVAGSFELIAGVLITIGLYAAYAAFIGSGQMAVAYFTAHFPNSFWPLANGGELAVLY
jgi:putative oxidoreductase